MKTLLATDGSEHAMRAMLAAGRLLVRRDNHFDTICVIPEFHPGAGSRPSGSDDLMRLRIDYEVKMKAEAEKLLEVASRALEGDGIKARPIVEVGSPADTLLERAEDYDVIVTGVHHRAERPGPGLGPVASRIIERAPATVLVGRPLLNEKSFRILVAVDGSAASRNAVEVLRTGFRLTDADITVMHVVEKPWLHLELEEEWPGGGEQAPDEETPDTELERLFGTELRSEAEEIVEETRSRLAGLGAGTESLLLEGNPGPEILGQAETGEYDLVVVGATGVSDLKHSLLGSVSYRVASNAPCSVAVVR